MKVLAATSNAVDFVQEVATGLRKRSKSIKHRGALLEWERVKEIENGVESEIGRLDINISYRVASSPVHLRLIVWADRWIWIDARRRAKTGWAWESTMEGRFLGRQGARDLIQKVEETISATWNAEKEALASIERIWKPHLALGPKRL